jgi:hypothetical protein
MYPFNTDIYTLAAARCNLQISYDGPLVLLKQFGSLGNDCYSSTLANKDYCMHAIFIDCNKYGNKARNISNPVNALVFQRDAKALSVYLQHYMTNGHLDLVDQNGWNPILWTAHRNLLDRMKLLIQYGADVRVRERQGWNAFTLAAMTNSYACLLFLIHWRLYCRARLHLKCKKNTVSDPLPSCGVRFDVFMDEINVIHKDDVDAVNAILNQGARVSSNSWIFIKKVLFTLRSMEQSV